MMPHPGPRGGRVAAGAGRRLRLVAGGSASRRPGRRQPSQPSAGGHPRAARHRRPALPARAVAPRCGAAPAALNGNLNTILTAVINGKLTAAALNRNVTADLTGGGAGGRVRARPAGQALPVGRRRPRRLRLLRAGMAGLATRRPLLASDERRRPAAIAAPARARRARYAGGSWGSAV